MPEQLVATQADLEEAYHTGFSAGREAGKRETQLAASIEAERFRVARSHAEVIVAKRERDRA